MTSFKGRNDAETYLEWERKVDMIFSFHNYSEQKKVRLAAVEFSDYALVWWDELVKSRRRNGEDAIETWDEMKRMMKKLLIIIGSCTRSYIGLLKDRSRWSKEMLLIGEYNSS